MSDNPKKTESRQQADDAQQEIKKEMDRVKQEAKEDKAQKPAKQPKDTTQAKIDELTNDLQRVQAEFENYKKRCEKESAQCREYAVSQLIKKLLTVLDSFEMAFKNTDNPGEFMKGVELIYSQFYNILKDEGLQPIEAKPGQQLDTYYHEVMLSEASEHDHDTILEELQKGFKFKEAVIRHAKVKVAKK
jgi:molecular chaperone GrpE